MSEQLNSTALHDLAVSVHDIANRRAGVMSTFEVVNLELAHEQLNRFAASIERPVPTTDMTAMSHESTGFCFCGQIHGRIDAWNEHDWAALREYMPAVHPVPNLSLPTREQIVEAMRPEIATYKAVAHGSDEALYTADSDMPERIADAVLALLQKGADR